MAHRALFNPFVRGCIANCLPNLVRAPIQGTRGADEDHSVAQGLHYMVTDSPREFPAPGPSM